MLTPAVTARLNNTSVQATPARGSQMDGHVHRFFFFASRRRHTRCSRDWSSDVCSSDLVRECVESAVCAEVDLLPCLLADIGYVQIAGCSIEREAPGIAQAVADDLPARDRKSVV